MYLGFWRPIALKPAPLLGVGRKCALELSNLGQARARFAMMMMTACYNLKRLTYFQKAGIKAF